MSKNVAVYMFRFYSFIHHLFSDKTSRIFYKRNSLQQCYYFAILLCEIFTAVLLLLISCQVLVLWLCVVELCVRGNFNGRHTHVLFFA